MTPLTPLHRLSTASLSGVVRAFASSLFSLFFSLFFSTPPNEFFQIQAYLIHWFRLLALLFSLFAADKHAHRLDAHWLQHYHCHDRRADVECRSNKEHDLPAADRHLQHIGERHKERCRAFGGVEKTIVSRSECASVDIGARCRKQTIDLTPRKEHDAREEDEQERVVCIEIQKPDADALCKKRDEHRVLAADIVRHPTEERATEAV